MKALRSIFGILFVIVFLPQASAVVQEDSLRELLIIEDGYQKN